MLTERGKQIRRDTLLLARQHGGYHFGGSFSCVEILTALYDRVMQNGDIFILSKGHACWPLYVILHEQGKAPRLQSHPHRDPANGIAWTSGSLGHGFPAAVGMALARKHTEHPGRVFVLMGDGECQEGTTWESLLIAGRRKLDNLTVIIDNNRIQGSDYTDEVLSINPIFSTAESAGFITSMIIRGNDEDAVANVLYKRYAFPHLVLAQTEKGHGVSFMEDLPAWHAKWPNDDELAKALEELT